MSQIRVLIVDDHTMFRDGLRAVLEHQEDVQVVGEAGDADAAIRLAAELNPTVILMDLRLPRRDGIEATRAILAAQPTTKIIALTMYYDDELIARAIQAGVQGYVLKDARAAELLEAVRSAQAGGAAITPAVAARVLDHYRHMADQDAANAEAVFSERERTLLRHLADGRSNREIAVAMSLSEQTIKNGLSGLYQKLGVRNRTEAVMVALDKGLIERDP